MGQISTTDARALFTKKLIAVYSDTPRPTGFLRSFFRIEESDSKELSIEVMRGSERIAVDVERGTEGNRNQFSKSTEKIFVPPYYREYFDATEIDLYDALFRPGYIDSAIFAKFISNVAKKYRELVAKIERAYELQCAQALLTGIVQLKAGINIDYKRKAASMVDLGAINVNRYWTKALDATATPYRDIQAMCEFIRTQGLTDAGTFNMIMGRNVLPSLLEMEQVLKRNDIKNISLDIIQKPQRNSVGGVLHGQLTAGPYLVNLWSYPQYYDKKVGENYVKTPYIDDNKVIVVPDMTDFVLGYGAVPQLLPDSDDIVPQTGAYVFGEYKDPRAVAHIMDVKSAGVAILLAVDTVVTYQVLADA